MTTTPNTLPKMRKSYLASINQAESETNLLRGILAELEKSQPMLFDSNVDETLEAINQNKTLWTPSYFSRQKKQAEQCFSRERVNHLLEVREYFRLRGDKGFVPKVLPLTTSVYQEDISGYNPSNNLRKFVDKGDLITIRAVLRMDLISRNMESKIVRLEFAWAKAHVPGLCEPYIEKAFSRGMDQDRSNWNKDYFFSQEGYLETVFSEERFLHMVDVREHLRQKDVERSESVSTPEPKIESNQSSRSDSASDRASTAQDKHSGTSSNDQEQPSFIKAALLIGGAIAALVVLLLSLRK